MLHILRFFLSNCRLFHNATFFGSCIIHILHTGCAKIKKKSDAKEIFVNFNWVATRWQLYSTHLHTNNTQNNTKQTIHRTTQKLWEQHKILEEWGPDPDLASYTLAFVLQLRKKHGKSSVRVEFYSQSLSVDLLVGCLCTQFLIH
jgi:hypothetical protein